MREQRGAGYQQRRGDSELERALIRATGSAADRAGRALIPPGSSVLVGCSGGADSVALAVGLCQLARSDAKLELRIAIAHVDHGLRAESAAEAEQVRALAEALGAPFLLEKLDVPALREAISRDGLEAAARDFRYAALERMAVASGFMMVATAHTRRDQAETVLLRLARGGGGGLGALAGIRVSRALGAVQLVRPLLETSREATESFCRSRGLSVVRDPHNQDPNRARARVRTAFAELSTLLNPRLEEHLAASAKTAAEEDSLLDQLAREAVLAARETVPAAADIDGEALSIGPLAKLPDPLLRRALLIAANLSGVRPQRVHLEQLCTLLRRGSGSIDLPGARALLGAGLLRFDHPVEAGKRAEDHPASTSIAGPGCYAWRDLVLEVTEAAGLPESKPASREIASLSDTLHVDAARAPFPWTLRGLAPGDRFRPARGHEKKISDLWIDAKIPRERRSQMPLLADAAGVVFFAAGLRPGSAAVAPFSQPVAFRFLQTAAASLRKNPALVEQRATEPRANIPASIDEESR